MPEKNPKTAGKYDGNRKKQGFFPIQLLTPPFRRVTVTRMKIIRQHPHRSGGVSKVTLNREHADAWLEERHYALPLWVPMAHLDRYFGPYQCVHEDYPHCAVELIVAGEFQVTGEGRKHRLGPGEAALLAPRGSYEMELDPGESCVRAGVVFTGTRIHEMLSVFGMNEFRILRVPDAAAIPERVLRLHALLRERRPENEPEICGLGYELLMRYSRTTVPAVPPKLEAALGLLALRVPCRVAIAEVARELHMSISALEKLFQLHLHDTPRRYLTSLRMKSAVELLCQSGLTIAQVAEKVGYSDAHSFSREFARIHGLPPREYRKNR